MRDVRENRAAALFCAFDAPDCAARVMVMLAPKETAMAKRMLILRGNATTDTSIYPDETGKTRAWPEGALHEKAARAFAKKLEYEDVMVEGSGSNQTMQGQQAKDALKKFHEDEKAEMGFYGFSGGGYTLWAILKFMAKSEPQSLLRIRHVVVVGAPNSCGDDAIYKPGYYNALVDDKVKKDKDWQVNWVLIFRKNPKWSQMPKGVTLPKDVDTHMFGPDVLLSGWPEDPKPESKLPATAYCSGKK
jgi:hypothetical protein